MEIEPLEIDIGLWNRGGFRGLPQCEAECSFPARYGRLGIVFTRCGAAAEKRISYSRNGYNIGKNLCRNHLREYVEPMVKG